MKCGRAGFFAGQKSGSDLCGLRAKPQRSLDPARVRDTPAAITGTSTALATCRTIDLILTRESSAAARNEGR